MSVETAIVLLFWSAAALIFYVYAGYPAALWVWARVRPRDIAAADAASPAGGTIVIAARNEGRRLRARDRHRQGHRARRQYRRPRAPGLLRPRRRRGARTRPHPELLEDEVRIALGLLGVPRLSALDKSYLRPATPVTLPHATSAFPLLGEGY